MDQRFGKSGMNLKSQVSQPVKLSAPPVYRPQALQPQMQAIGMIAGWKPGTAPPVYRPVPSQVAAQPHRGPGAFFTPLIRTSPVQRPTLKPAGGVSTRGPIIQRMERTPKDVAEFLERISNIGAQQWIYGNQNNNNNNNNDDDEWDTSWFQTEGGMAEDDAMKIANHFGWEVEYQEFTCSDKKHTPKGRLFYSKKNNCYYGADNSGHVGWGFKVWSKKNKTTLDYQGNLVWNGSNWKHIER